MTIDKIKHYLGENLFNFHASLTPAQLTKVKTELETEIIFQETINKKSEVLFMRNVELNYINHLLG